MTTLPDLTVDSKAWKIQSAKNAYFIALASSGVLVMNWWNITSPSIIPSSILISCRLKQKEHRALNWVSAEIDFKAKIWVFWSSRGETFLHHSSLKNFIQAYRHGTCPPWGKKETVHQNMTEFSDSSFLMYRYSTLWYTPWTKICHTGTGFLTHEIIW